MIHNKFTTRYGATFTVGNQSWHSYQDFGLYPEDWPDIGAAEPRMRYVTVYGSDGAIDMTEALTGYTEYNDREIDIRFIVSEQKRWDAVLTRLSSALHGKRGRVVFDESPEFYLVGRFSVLRDNDEASASITVHGVMEPYKYAVRGPTEAWLWDPFNFETGVIRETGAINVQGSATIPVVSSPYGGIPTITSTAAMTMVCGGVTYTITAGTNVLEDLILPRDESIVYMAFSGSGVVSIDYVVGYL